MWKSTNDFAYFSLNSGGSLFPDVKNRISNIMLTMTASFNSALANKPKIIPMNVDDEIQGCRIFVYRIWRIFSLVLVTGIEKY